jgi:hypothetical protein
LAWQILFVRPTQREENDDQADKSNSECDCVRNGHPVAKAHIRFRLLMQINPEGFDFACCASAPKFQPQLG